VRGNGSFDLFLSFSLAKIGEREVIFGRRGGVWFPVAAGCFFGGRVIVF